MDTILHHAKNLASSVGDAVKSATSGTPMSTATSDSASSRALGAAPESSGRTMTGGRRHKKDSGRKHKTQKKRRGGKKSWY